MPATSSGVRTFRSQALPGFGLTDEDAACVSELAAGFEHAASTHSILASSKTLAGVVSLSMSVDQFSVERCQSREEWVAD